MSTHLALVLEEGGNPLVSRRLETPEPGAGQALVRLRCAALNHRDLWIRKGAYGNVPGLPCVPGSDGFGFVESVGSKADEARVGSAVVLLPGVAWGGDDAAPGPDWRVFGIPDSGTFSQYVVVPVEQLFDAPKGWTPEEAAALPLAGVTAHRALFRRGGLRAGEKVLLTGIGGGAARFALQFAIAAGAEVWVTSGSAEKLEAAKKSGAKGGVLYTEPGWGERLAAAAGRFDLCMDSAAGPGWKEICEALKPGGRLVFFGATRGAPEVPMRKAFFKQISILGTALGSTNDFRAMLAFVEAHDLRPAVDSVFDLEDAEKALERLERGAQTGKIVLRIP